MAKIFASSEMAWVEILVLERGENIILHFRNTNNTAKGVLCISKRRKYDTFQKSVSFVPKNIFNEARRQAIEYFKARSKKPKQGELDL